LKNPTRHNTKAHGGSVGVFKSSAHDRLANNNLIANRVVLPANSRLMSGLDRERLHRAVERVNRELIAAIGPDGHWVGELSSSALSTATAVTALAVVQRESHTAHHAARLTSGLEWLAQHQNSDGGWGDTVLSLSNLSTTTLCWAAFGVVPRADEKFSATVHTAEKWIARRIATSDLPHLTPALSPPAGSGEGEKPGAIDTDSLARAIIARYGKDRTFSVPILTMCALAGRLGSGRDAWRHVIPLPFELAACPHSWFAALRLPVVSYALPALIAIGQARHHHSPSRNPVARLARNLTREATLRKLTHIQPMNGGFLEATPLTSFVTMSLAGSGQANHPVTKRGVEFLATSQSADGSWPIDTNLATWVTTLAVNALDKLETRNPELETQLRSWLLNQQYRTIHPYTHAAPGGWAWTDLPGGVPDADDTAGALLALRELGPIDDATREAAMAGITWLLDLQNRDGGIPTFCRGWGALPFDQSSADITAHAIRAWLAWKKDVPELSDRLNKSIWRAARFLFRNIRPDGSWVPLWFGNQWNNGEENPLYGTARVVAALSQTHQSVALEHGVAWLAKAQQDDGSWSGGSTGKSSVEETALAIEALAGSLNAMSDADLRDAATKAVQRGVNWLLARVESGEWTQPSPIGFYFAKLWYYEKLYPIIFTVGALNRVAALMDSHSTVTR
jgi:squalene-hopene/tetraprenyl-beta-curcumene cyclase